MGVNMLHAWTRRMLYCYTIWPVTVCIHFLGSAHIRPDMGEKRWQGWKESSVAAMTLAGNVTFPVLSRALLWQEGWQSWPSRGEVGLCGARRGTCFPLGVCQQIPCFYYSLSKFKWSSLSLSFGKRTGYFYMQCVRPMLHSPRVLQESVGMCKKIYVWPSLY